MTITKKYLCTHSKHVIAKSAAYNQWSLHSCSIVFKQACANGEKICMYALFDSQVETGSVDSRQSVGVRKKEGEFVLEKRFRV